MLPNRQKIEKGLLIVNKCLAKTTLENLNRRSEVHITIKDGQASMEVVEENGSISHSMRLREIERRANQTPDTNDKNKNSEPVEDLSDGVKDAVLK